MALLLRSLILQQAPVQEVLVQLRKQLLQDHDVQQTVLAAVNHLIAVDERCNLPYTRRVLQSVSNELIKQNIQIDDAFGDLLQQQLLATDQEDANSDEKGWRVKIYMYRQLFNADEGAHDAAIVQNMVLRVSSDMLAGDTGCHEWEAGFKLAELVLSAPEVFKGRTVLELGCGCGMVGVALHRAGASRIHLTDGDAQTVANCTENLQRNGVSVREQPGSQSGMHCYQLQWENGTDMQPDIVLAADVLYDPVVIPPLLKLLHTALQPLGKLRGQDPVLMLPEESIAPYQAAPKPEGTCHIATNQDLLPIQSKGQLCVGASGESLVAEPSHSVNGLPCLGVASRGIHTISHHGFSLEKVFIRLARLSEHGTPYALIMTRIRNANTLRTFLTQAVASGLQVFQVHVVDCLPLDTPISCNSTSVTPQHITDPAVPLVHLHIPVPVHFIELQALQKSRGSTVLHLILLRSGLDVVHLLQPS